MPRKKKAKTPTGAEDMFGYGRHGSNVPHWVPTLEEIAEACRKIRDSGYVDSDGIYHEPWDDRVRYFRLTGRIVMPTIQF